MSGIKVVTAWTTSAVPTSTQKSFMRVDFSDDDTLIGELVDKDEAEMLEYKNFGRKSLNELIEKLETMGLKFGMDTSPYTEDEA